MANFTGRMARSDCRPSFLKALLFRLFIASIGVAGLAGCGRKLYPDATAPGAALPGLAFNSESPSPAGVEPSPGVSPSPAAAEQSPCGIELGKSRKEVLAQYRVDELRVHLESVVSELNLSDLASLRENPGLAQVIYESAAEDALVRLDRPGQVDSNTKLLWRVVSRSNSVAWLRATYAFLHAPPAAPVQFGEVSLTFKPENPAEYDISAKDPAGKPIQSFTATLADAVTSCRGVKLDLDSAVLEFNRVSSTLFPN